ncbi:MAG: DUF3685 domain-containing protein [Cyanobacteria bacterium P01_A01_bin.45]
MSDRVRQVNLLLIDRDPIFRMGLKLALEEFPDIEVVSEVSTDTQALQKLAELAQDDLNAVNLVILELGNGRSTYTQQLGIQLCRQLKTQYPHLPVLLLSNIVNSGILLAAKSTGVDGYCPKGTPITEVVDAIASLANGESYWGEEFLPQQAYIQQESLKNSTESDFFDTTPLQNFGVDSTSNIYTDKSYGGQNDTNTTHTSHQNIEKKVYRNRLIETYLGRIRHNLYSSGINYIRSDLQQVTAKLQVPGLPILERALLAGKHRELLAARWLVKQILATPQPAKPIQEPLTAFFESTPEINAIVPSDATQIENSPSLLSPRALQSKIFTECINKLQFPLENITDITLEVDIFREVKKRELFYLILQKFANILDDLRFSKIEIIQLPEIKTSILKDLWRETIKEFYGKFSLIRIDNRQIEIASFLLENSSNVEEEILFYIPLVPDILAYLLFQIDLSIDNTSYSAGSKEANERVEMILENLLIQVANAVVSPLLNSLADVEAIKQAYYEQKLCSTREIERFRNNLSWRYRLRNNISEPQAIFESRYQIFIFVPRGITKISIYSPRTEELLNLSGLPLFVTMALELGDASSPRIKGILSFFGNGVVFVLTKIIGRGIGLIGRGILQGIGSVSLTERKK